jgi:hypothetical protein
VEGLRETGNWVPVYNLRVADWHTYFVGDDSWGFSVWAHNQCDGYYLFEDLTAATTTWAVYKRNGTGRPVAFNGQTITGATSADVEAKLNLPTSPISTGRVVKDIQNPKYGTYLNSFPDGKDQLMQKEFTDHVPEWPQTAPLPHAHHIVMKAGRYGAVSFVKKTQKILQSVGIDPIFGYDNLVWAPNWPEHKTGTVASKEPGASGKGYAESVYDRIKNSAVNGIYNKSDVVSTLQAVARNFIRGVW